MSADNWTNCPKCTHAQEDYLELLTHQKTEYTETQYGKESYDQFSHQLDRFAIEIERVQKRLACPTLGFSSKTFREDWEIGIVGKQFFVSYKGRCSECHLVYEFKHTTDVLWEDLKKGAL